MDVPSINVSQSLAHIINKAGDKSGVDFDYLLQTAARESSLNPQAKASTSSAVGLFQFLEQTWFEVLKTDGVRLGYGDVSKAIVTTVDGDLTIPNKELRGKALGLREDPQMASDMAAAFTKNNGKYLEERFGRRPSAGELYIAHFLGARGAERLFQAGLNEPDQSAVDIFPRQAKANPSIFFDGGKPRSVRQLYQVLVAKHSVSSAPSSSFATQQIASTNEGVRAEPMPMSFKSLYSSEPVTRTQSPVQKTNAASGGLFTQFYEK